MPNKSCLSKIKVGDKITLSWAYAIRPRWASSGEFEAVVVFKLPNDFVIATNRFGYLRDPNYSFSSSLAKQLASMNYVGYYLFRPEHFDITKIKKNH